MKPTKINMTEHKKSSLAFLSLRQSIFALGGEAEDMILALAFADQKPKYPKTMGGKVWWRLVETCCGYKIQQNIISQHYRALDGEDGRICSSFDLEEVRRQLRELEGV